MAIAGANLRLYPALRAGMAELVDASDLKSEVRKDVPVQVRLPAPGFAASQLRLAQPGIAEKQRSLPGEARRA